MNKTITDRESLFNFIADILNIDRHTDITQISIEIKSCDVGDIGSLWVTVFNSDTNCVVFFTAEHTNERIWEKFDILRNIVISGNIGNISTY